eukprot:8326596-Pyramimonas_sp.AAC.1
MLRWSEIGNVLQNTCSNCALSSCPSRVCFQSWVMMRAATWPLQPSSHPRTLSATNMPGLQS